jgi:rod shape-determining protein MreD
MAMTNPLNSEKGLIVPVSFVVALMLAAMPMPELLALARPAWVALVLVYWCIALPLRVGVGAGWLMGLFLDVLKGTLLGLNAASYALLAYVTIKNHKRFRTFPLTKQAAFIGLMLSIQALLMLWTRKVPALPSIVLSAYWMPVVVSMHLWPAVFHVLKHFQRKASVSPSSLEFDATV